MKMRKIALCISLVLVMVATLVLAVACDKEKTIDFKAADDWGYYSDSVTAEEKASLTASNNSNGDLVFTFASKYDTYTLMKSSLLAMTDANIVEQMNTLVVVAKMTTNNPHPAMLFKFEGSENHEITVRGTTEYTTYEWDVSEFDLKKSAWLDIFPDPGVAGTSGSITISDIYLTSKEMNPANDASKLPPETGSNNEPAEITWNEVTASNLAIGSWADAGSGAYSVTKTGNTYKVDVTKGIGDEWVAVVAYIFGDALKDMKSFKITLKGEAGTRILVKPFDACETPLDFDGTEQEVVVNIASHAADAARDFSKKDDATPDNKVALLALPGANSGSTSFEIISAEFSTEEVQTPEVPEVSAIEYNGGQSLNFNNYWHDGGDGKWQASEAEGVWTATYPAGNDWSQLVTEIKLGDAKMNYVVLEVKGTAGSKAIFNVGVGEAKFEGNEWDNGLMTGEWQRVTVSNFENPLTGDFTIRVFAGLSADCAAGEIQIRVAQMYYVSESELDEDGNLAVSADWQAANKGDDRFTIVAGEGSTTITTVKDDEFDAVIIWVDLGEGGFDKFSITINGTEGHKAIISLNGVEQKFEGNEWDNGLLTGEDQTVVFDATGLTGMIAIRLMFDFDNTHGGEFVISEIVFIVSAE